MYVPLASTSSRRLGHKRRTKDDDTVAARVFKKLDPYVPLLGFAVGDSVVLVLTEQHAWMQEEGGQRGHGQVRARPEADGRLSQLHRDEGVDRDSGLERRRRCA